MTLNLDVATVQQALDALITGDHQAAAAQFTDDVVFTGAGGCLSGRTTGLPAVLDRFAELSRLTNGTFGTEVEGVYAGTHGSSSSSPATGPRSTGSRSTARKRSSSPSTAAASARSPRSSRPGPPSGIWD